MSENIEGKLLAALEEELGEKRYALSTLQLEIEQLEGKITKFQEVFGAVSAQPTASTKTGSRKPRALTTKTVPVKKSTSRAAVGRREVAEGKRPKIKDAMKTVMGSVVMNATTVFEALKARDWLPNANNPRAYIAYLLSSLRDDFDRVEGRRGFYRVHGTVSESASATATKRPVRTETIDDTDAVLQDAGVIPASAN